MQTESPTAVVVIASVHPVHGAPRKGSRCSPVSAVTDTTINHSEAGADSYGSFLEGSTHG